MHHGLPLVLLLALAASGAASAQSGDPIPDPTPPEQYYPLAVGNEWVFVEDIVAAYREVVVRDTVAGGETFAVVERTVIGTWDSGMSRDTTRFTVRVDAETAHVVYLQDGLEVTDGCPLDADFPADPHAGRPVDCGGMAATLTGGDGQYVQPGLFTMDGFEATTKRFAIEGGQTVAYAAGVGPVAREGVERIVYARIDGVETGLVPQDDPTDPARYYPLAVGTEREVFRSVPGELRRTRQVIPRDTLVGGVRYAVEQTFVAGDTVSDWGVPTVRLLRFDPETTVVMQWGGVSESPITCPLGSPFDVVIACPGEYGRATVVGGGVGAFTLSVGGEEVAIPALKRHGGLADGFADVGSPGPYGADIGRLPQTDFAFCTVCSETLTYLRTVDADGTIAEYGARYAVASDAAPEAGGLTLAAGPSPTAGPLTLHLGGAVAEAVTVEVFDALGRRVWTREVASRQPVAVDASGWAPGAYVIRARTGREAVTATVIRR